MYVNTLSGKVEKSTKPKNRKKLMKIVSWHSKSSIFHYFWKIISLAFQGLRASSIFHNFWENFQTL